MEGRFEKLFKNIVKIWKRPESSEDKDIEKVTLKDIKKAAEFLFDEQYYSQTIVGDI